MAKAMATEGHMNFIAIKGALLRLHDGDRLAVYMHTLSRTAKLTARVTRTRCPRSHSDIA